MADNYYIATRKRSNPSTSSVSLWRKRRLAVIQMSVSTQSSSEVTRNEQSDDSFTDISNDVEDNDFLFIKSDLSNCNSEVDVSLTSSESVSYGNKEDENKIYDESLCSKLRCWALTHRCTRQCINGALKLFLECKQSVPLDSRTLLKTKRSIASINIEGYGDYIYLGLKTQIEKQISSKSIKETSLYLTFNIDGIPLFKSNSTQLWPILASILGMEPFVVGLYCGNKKPPCDVYLCALVNELNELQHNALHVNNIDYIVTVYAFVCDAPARAMLKGIISHCGFHSCERCTMVGRSLKNRIVFSHHEKNVVLRTDQIFRTNGYFFKDDNNRSHQISKSPLHDVESIGFVSMFLLDYMHLVCLGVMRRILYFLKGSIKGTSSGKLSANMVNQVSEKLTSLNGKLPSDFVRQPRSLVELDRWKATELHSFLLYTGIFALKDVVDNSVYKHFLSLCLAIRFLCESDDATRNSNLQNAERLLRYFVTNSVDVYGHLFCVYNVHSLLHLCEDVQNYGVSLDNLSAFKFENYLQKLKKMISGTRNPLIQVAKRLDELNDFHQTPKNTFRISVSDKDNCFITNSSVVFVKNVVGDQFHCIKFKKHSLDNFFTDFVQSKDIDIFFLRKNAISTPCVKQKHDILRKCVCMPTHNGFVILALVHNVDTRQL
ncbi:uncharacterized protein LOC124810418 isoform X1 [Hydra vulgaris]|uniref:uncharacterized protein LOC124810418 isoform X1 n=1 Tax=Hydra vulgaris TaxID=6087 RepID=UPI0032E9E4B3